MLVRFPRLAGMVPFSLLVARFLQQWEHEVKTMQRERERERQRRSEIHHYHPHLESTAHRQPERSKRGRTYRRTRLLRFPRLAGMVPVSWFW